VTRARVSSTALVLIAVAVLLVYPLVMPRFWVLSVASQAMILGIVALSLIFMDGYGGMISLAQAAIAGLAAYFAAIAAIKMGMPWLPSAVVGALVAALAGVIFGAISARSYGIYFLMLTLALAVGVFYLVLQNYDIFGGHIGFAGIVGPTGQPRANFAAFYYLCLAFAAAIYVGLRYLARSQLGLTFQGIRDNPRRMRALGYWVGLHRVVMFGIAGFVAGLGGVLGIWYRGNISPGIVDVQRTLDVLIIAVVGGLTYPIGAFVGAIFFVLVQTFASSLTLFGYSFDERFNTLIGLSFLLVVVFAPQGLVGLADRIVRTARRGLVARGTSATAPEVTDEPEPPVTDPFEHPSGDSMGSAP
jgi:branched-chain amino acid transport system permease protein